MAIFLDDTSSMFQLVVGDLVPTPDKNYFGGSASLLTPPPPDLEGVMILDVSFIGRWVARSFSANTTIDGKSPSEIHFVELEQRPVIDVIYQSPNLSDARHDLNFFVSSKGAGVYVDYAIILVTENTALNGERLIVDESDPSVVWEGNWALDSSMLTNPIDGFIRRPYGNTTHRTSSLGASVAFRFNGLNLSIRVRCQFPQSVAISIGDVYHSAKDGVQTDYSLSESGSGNSTNFQWYQKDGLSPTTHTLNMTVVNVFNNPSFNLDYILYTPSFTSLSEQEASSIQQSSSSQSQATNTAIGPQISATLPSTRPGISRGALSGAIIGPVLFGVFMALTLIVMRRKKLLFWSSQRKSNTSRTLTPHRHTRWWARIWQRTESRTLEAFPPNWNSSSNNRPMVQHKPPFEQRRESHQSDAGSANETIVADPRVQELEELVISLQQEIEETRQDRYGAQNGALMRELVGSHSELPNERGRQENGDYVSVTMSATVV
ncbi:hypothetical protein C0995_012119 [Termitomyces sp. Mi166|nr:hypothetical protein C0995_012119 [Termitomyces sp. Mi166\